jgi:hypothetical protein
MLSPSSFSPSPSRPAPRRLVQKNEASFMLSTAIFDYANNIQYKDVTSYEAARLAGRRTLADFLEQLELEKFRID